MLIAYFSLAGGLLALIFAGDMLVRGSVGIAQKLGIPNLVIGLTIVAFGTSAPELFISLEAGLAGSGGLALGNVVGSNIANVLLVLGVPALIAATPCGEKGATRTAMFMVAVSVVFIAMCFQGVIGLTSGIILLVLLIFFLVDSARSAMRHRKDMKAAANDCTLEEVDGVPASTALAIGYIVIGLVGLPLGGHLTIQGATAIARDWGVSEATIGLTVVALGTSLPELATTVMAAVRKHGGVALGNVIGSNIFNILAIIGITTVVVPLRVPPEILYMDVWVMLGCSLLLLGLANYRICLRKTTGAVLSLGYVGYVIAVYALG
ncbi:MAG: calcium/sodium antiporter [Rhodobacteraceae bacterium]|nr:calcium/sodium antiporter [Paracoccaceae bacterium]